MMSMLASLVFVIGVTALDSFRQAQAAICNVSAPTDPTLCYETFSYPIASVVTTATPGTWEFIASDLQNLFGQSNTVDPMMWLLDNSGNILGIADDSIGSLAPKLTLTFYATVDVTIILGGFTDDRQGTVDLTVRKIGTSGTVWQDLWFGGWRRDGHRVELGDRMFVGFPHGGVSGGTPGNLLLVLSTSATTCTSGGCGSYIVSPWTAGTLSQVRVPFTSSNGSVVVGSWFQNTLQGTRWFHSRLGASWGTGSLYNDSDCDGLTVEVEELASTDENLNVQSCDNDSPSAGSRCDKFRQRIEIPTQWRANDTDHDGLRDDWELYGVKRTCTKFPAPPHFNPGACIDDTWRYTGKLGNFCGEPNVAVAYTATNALSTFGIKPTTPSVLAGC